MQRSNARKEARLDNLTNQCLKQRHTLTEGSPEALADYLRIHRVLAPLVYDYLHCPDNNPRN
jgi:hypothetical protein